MITESRESMEHTSKAAHEGHWRAMQYTNDIIKTNHFPNWENIITSIHREILAPSVLPEHRDQFAGKYRRTNAYVLDSSVETSPWFQVHEDMYQYGLAMDKKIAELKPGIENIGNLLDTIAWAHYELVRIHPFVDGNGRTARQAMDLLCKRFRIKTIILGRIHKDGYLDALKRVDQTKDLDHLTLFLSAQSWGNYERGDSVRDEISRFYIDKKIKQLNESIISKHKKTRK